MIEVETKPQSVDQVAEKFMKELLRHFHQDPPDVSEDQGKPVVA